MKLTSTTFAVFPVALGLLCFCSSFAAAQPPPHQTSPAAGNTWELAGLYQAAIDTDPRLRALQLQATQTELRLRNIEAERLPTIAAEGQAQYQSDVPTAPVFLPGGQPLFSASKDTYDAHVRVEQRLMDPTIRPRLAAERAQLAEAQARVRTTLFGLRQEVNEAFFAAAVFQERAGALAATIADLDGRLREMGVRVREGAALAADAAEIEASLLQRRQDDAELSANRRAALARLSRLTGRSFADTDVLGLPQVATAVAQARATVDDTRARPEYEQYARTQERLARQQDVATAQDQPRLSAYARVGYGRPGLNFISDQFESYGIAGVQVQWKVWSWGATNRERQDLALQQQIVAADEAAFTKGLGRSTEADLAAVDRLTVALALDDRIIALREEIERSTQARFQERVVTAAEYLDRTTELLQARFARAGHRVELAQAGATFLTTLGLEVR
jgi:outer membrane protein TolC